MTDKLETLLRTKTKIETPRGLEEKIMRRIHSESAQKKSFLGNMFNRYSYAFASAAAILIAVSVLWNIKNDMTISAEERELSKLQEEIKLYETANSILKQVEGEEKIQKDLENINELDEYINMLSS